jgi:glycosyltransferase involved in cell wall biosynthesis
MKIAWVFPQKERCGIALYSRGYIEAFGKSADIVCLDPSGWVSERTRFLSTVHRCDLVHIQYEASYYIDHRHDFYKDLCADLGVPIIISLHEVYQSFPDVYPREAIRGKGPLAMVKRLLYDRRHPLQTAYRRHAARSFHAEKILVHHEFQRAMVIGQGCCPDAVSVIPYPLMMIPDSAPPPPWSDKRPLHLASSGFINPHFDYDLLFLTLERLTIPWRFTWIGGIRRDEDAALQNKILSMVNERNWQERFVITGWISENELYTRLRDMDVVCAFFSARSSSGSLAAAFAAQRPVIATPLPLTEELSARSGVIYLSPADPDKLAEGIGKLAVDKELRSSMISNLEKYYADNNYSALSCRLMNLYGSVFDNRGKGGD